VGDSGLSGRSGLEWTQCTATERVVLADTTLSTKSTVAHSPLRHFAHSPVRHFPGAGLRSQNGVA
jgi:hypothetical protein